METWKHPNGFEKFKKADVENSVENVEKPWKQRKKQNEREGRRRAQKYVYEKKK